jgi:hypothetical protein
MFTSLMRLASTAPSTWSMGFLVGLGPRPLSASHYGAAASR